MTTRIPTIGRRSHIAIGTALVLLIAGGFYRLLVPSRARAANVIPFTVVRTESGYDKNGALKYTNQYIDAVRSDGSSATKITTSVVQQRRINLANGDHILTNDLLERFSTFPKKFAPGTQVHRDPSESCLSGGEVKVGWTVGGQDTIGGFRAVRVVHLEPSRKRTMTAWHALDHGCALLQMRFEHEDGLTVQNLTAFNRGEPDSSLFTTGARYQEGPPSNLYVPICAGDRCEEVPASLKGRLDKSYSDLRAKNK